MHSRNQGRLGLPEGIILALIVVGGIFGWLLMTGDPFYTLREKLPGSTFNAFDDLIQQTADRYQIEPELVKAVVWQESRFRPDTVGKAGERGLMQVMEPAASEWAKAENIQTFQPTDLLDAKTNLEAGTWYLARALSRYADRDDPIPFALAEYNAGKSRADRWIQGAEDDTSAEAFMAAIDFPTTLNYVENIIARRRFYQLRSEFTQP